MQRALHTDLDRLSSMAFGRLKHCGPLIQRFDDLHRVIDQTERPELLWNIYDWLMAPFSLWPIDFEGLATHLLDTLESSSPALRSAFDEGGWTLDFRLHYPHEMPATSRAPLGP